jgi:hypothetical protein
VWSDDEDVGDVIMIAAELVLMDRWLYRSYGGLAYEDAGSFWCILEKLPGGVEAAGVRAWRRRIDEAWI